MADLSLRRRERGISLIEVMVAVLVFSIGMLGLALLQLKGAQFTMESGSRTAAIGLARSLAESMRANPDGALPPGNGTSAYLYDGTTTYSASDCASTTASSPADVAKRDLACWQAALIRTLPPPTSSGGKMATVTKDPNLGTLVITVSWAGVAGSSSADPSQSYSLSYLQ